MRVLVDVGVGRFAEEALRQEGHDVLSVREVDPRATDDAVMRWAVEQGRLLITTDKDFGEMVARGREAHAGVLLLRMEAAGGPEKARVVCTILREQGESLVRRLAVYRGGRLRISG